MPSGMLSSPLSVREWRVGEASRRLDQFLVERGLSLSRSHVQRLVRDGRVTVDGQPAKASTPLKIGDLVRVDVPPPEPAELAPEEFPLRVVFEDQDVAVIDKPAGIAVHPGAGVKRGTLANALVSRWPGLASTGHALRPGIVHRLDKDTSGLMVVAKNESSYLSLTQQIKDRKLYKEYLALVIGELKPATGRIEAPIGRDPRNRRRMAVVEGGRPATTEYRVLERLGKFSLVQVHTITGRTHQIRVHMAAIGHPLAGDALYGKGAQELGRHFLHATRLGFSLPASGEFTEFESSLPPDLEGVLYGLRGAPHSR
ncbi:MAG: RluA family pseudouridine synthase [Dehalococcoidia bacterium]|nr:RluA family pseudouridine synthase [Dehalococcoidia bacterium]